MQGRKGLLDLGSTSETPCIDLYETNADLSNHCFRYSSGLFTGVKKEVGQGSIVNISSGAGIRAVPGLAVYCASKHAVIGLTRVWAADFPRIRVNAVLPGKLTRKLSLTEWSRVIWCADLENRCDRDGAL